MSRMTFFGSEERTVSEKDTLVARLAILTEYGNSLRRQIEKNEEEKNDNLEIEFDKTLQRVQILEQQLAKIEAGETKEEKPDLKSSSSSSSSYHSPVSRLAPVSPITSDFKKIPAKEKKPILISIFNAKGGVGKTTATYNIGYMLAQEFGLRVLMVDADAQCNLTGMILTEDELNDFYERQEEKRSSDENEELITIYDCFEPLINNEELPPLERAKRVKISPVKDYENLFYIPGHLSLSDIDNPICLGMNRIHGHDKYPALFTNFFRLVAEDNNIDIVLFDLGPHIVGLNPTVIMGSDYFATPFFPDSLSKQAIRNLQIKLPKWKNSEAFQKLQQKDPHDPWHINLNPRFLGAFPQKIKYRMDIVEESYASWIAKINTQVESLCQILESNGMLSRNFRKIKKTSGYGIKDFVGLGLDVLQAGRPICDQDYPFTHYKAVLLENDEYKTEQTKLSTNSKKILKEVFRAYQRLVCVLMQNMSHEDIEMLGEKFKEAIFAYRLDSEEDMGNTYIVDNGEVVDCHLALINGEIKDYTEIKVSGDGGECGFRVLGMTRPQAVHELQKLQNNPLVRYTLLCKELIESMDRFAQNDGADITLLMDEKPRQRVREIYVRTNQIKNDLDTLYNTARTSLQEMNVRLEDGNSNENILLNIRAYRLQNLDGELIRNILQHEDEYKQVRRQLRDDNEIFQSYINCYNHQPNGLFLGTKSMICIAQSMGIGITLWAPVPIKYFIQRTPITDEIKQEILRDRNVIITRTARLQFSIGFVHNNQYVQMPLPDNEQKLKILLERHDTESKQVTNREMRRLLSQWVIAQGARPNLWRMGPPIPPSSPEKGSINVILKGGHYNFLIEGRIEPTEHVIEQPSSTHKSRKRKGMEPVEQKEEGVEPPERRRSHRQASVAASEMLADLFSNRSTTGVIQDPYASRFEK
jgi:chromosome partitioning protein